MCFVALPGDAHLFSKLSDQVKSIEACESFAESMPPPLARVGHEWMALKAASPSLRFYRAVALFEEAVRIAEDSYRIYPDYDQFDEPIDQPLLYDVFPVEILSTFKAVELVRDQMAQQHGSDEGHEAEGLVIVNRALFNFLGGVKIVDRDNTEAGSIPAGEDKGKVHSEITAADLSMGPPLIPAEQAGSAPLRELQAFADKTLNKEQRKRLL